MATDAKRIGERIVLTDRDTKQLKGSRSTKGQLEPTAKKIVKTRSRNPIEAPLSESDPYAKQREQFTHYNESDEPLGVRKKSTEVPSAKQARASYNAMVKAQGPISTSADRASLSWYKDCDEIQYKLAIGKTCVAIKALDASMRPLGDTKVDLYRGMGGIDFDNPKVGDKSVSPFFAATSTDPIIAEKFSAKFKEGGIATNRPFIMRIDTTQARGFVIEGSGENEVIIARGTTFLVNNISEGRVGSQAVQWLDVTAVSPEPRRAKKQ